MIIHEPATLLTDYLLAGLAAGLAWRLHRSRSATNLAAQWWSRALGLTALSAFVGGSYHGFAPDFPTPVASAWWLITLWIISLLSAGMAMILLHELAPAGNQRLWRGLIGLKLALFAAVAVMQPVFVVVIIDYGLTMLAWIVTIVWLRRSWSGWMLAGIGLSVIAALVQQLRWAPSPHFNHNDLYHVIQALALGAFYRAAGKFSGAHPGQTRHAVGIGE
jgi:hypothetical protein